ncbi:MAG: hypothetical protein E7148_04255 [Rikenellaceae bacterium]|nr:hypothetical protein [Rikenellaceae bacterium]
MLGFSPYKKHANKFNYIPRYFDPAKEAREQRRAELHGERSDQHGEYTPGQYIRTQREARAARYNKQEQGRGQIWKKLAIAGLLLIFISLLYPRLAELFIRMKAPRTTVQSTEEFDPSRPITVVPNDYKE